MTRAVQPAPSGRAAECPFLLVVAVVAAAFVYLIASSPSTGCAARARSSAPTCSAAGVLRLVLPGPGPACSPCAAGRGTRCATPCSACSLITLGVLPPAAADGGLACRG